LGVLLTLAVALIGVYAMAQGGVIPANAVHNPADWKLGWPHFARSDTASRRPKRPKSRWGNSDGNSASAAAALFLDDGLGRHARLVVPGLIAQQKVRSGFEIRVSLPRIV
jgi:hypothetical protein